MRCGLEGSTRVQGMFSTIVHVAGRRTRFTISLVAHTVEIERDGPTGTTLDCERKPALQFRTADAAGYRNSLLGKEKRQELDVSCTCVVCRVPPATGRERRSTGRGRRRAGCFMFVWACRAPRCSRTGPRHVRTLGR